MTPKSLRIAAAFAATGGTGRRRDFSPVAAAQSVATAKSKAPLVLPQPAAELGGFGGSGQTASTAPWVVQAIAAAGGNPSTFKRVGGRARLPICSRSTSTARHSARPDDAQSRDRLREADHQLSRRPRDVAHQQGGEQAHQPGDAVLAYRNSKSGAFTTTSGGGGTYAAVSTTTWAVLALKAAGQSSSQVAKSVSWLRNHQASSGGFSYTPAGHRIPIRRPRPSRR